MLNDLGHPIGTSVVCVRGGKELETDHKVQCVGWYQSRICVNADVAVMGGEHRQMLYSSQQGLMGGRERGRVWDGGKMENRE